MRNIGPIAALALFGAVASCSSAPSARVDVPNISICEFSENPKSYLGKTIVVSATHHTVEGYEDYLTTDACSADNRLSIDDWSEDASVRSYERARKKECAGAGLCGLTAHVVVELTIHMGEAGHLHFGETPVGQLKRVLSYQFVR